MFSGLKSILAYSQKKVNQYGAPYETFGTFCLLNYIFPFFIWVQPLNEYEDTLIYLRIIGALLCILLILKDEWPSFLVPYLPLIWHIAVGYCLPFTSTVTFILSGFNPDWLMSILGITILLLIVLDWVTAAAMAIFGIGMGLLFCKIITSFPTVTTDSFHISYLIVYQGVFGLLIGLLFARRKEQTFNNVLLQNQQLTEVQRDARQNLADVLTYREELLTEISPNQMAMFDDITTAYIQQAIYRITDYLRLDVRPIKLSALQKNLADLYTPARSDQPQLLFKQYTQVDSIEGDLLKIKQLLINAIQYLHQRHTTQPIIYIFFEEAQLGHHVEHMKGYTRTLEAIKITITTHLQPPPTLPIYTIEPGKDSTWGPQVEDENVLVENARITDAHYGYIAELSTHTLTYVIPINLREVRGKVMEIIRKPAREDPEELKHPLAIQLEKELMERIKDSTIDPQIIQKALSIIKKYHGGTKRRSGEPFFTHPMAVALIVLEHSDDQQTVLGALLHDTVEDTSLSLEDIKRYFDETVAFLVAKATNLEDHKRRISLSDKENIVRIVNYEDSRAPLIKLADRLHNMRTIQFHKPERQQYIAQETLQEFVPLAKELKLLALAEELADLSKAVLEK